MRMKFGSAGAGKPTIAIAGLYAACLREPTTENNND